MNPPPPLGWSPHAELAPGGAGARLRAGRRHLLTPSGSTSSTARRIPARARGRLRRRLRRRLDGGSGGGSDGGSGGGSGGGPAWRTRRRRRRAPCSPSRVRRRPGVERRRRGDAQTLGERVFVEVQRAVLRQQRSSGGSSELHRLTRAMRAGARGWTTADRSSPEGVITRRVPWVPLVPRRPPRRPTLAAPTLAASALAGPRSNRRRGHASPDSEERSGGRAGSGPVEGDGTAATGAPSLGRGVRARIGAGVRGAEAPAVPRKLFSKNAGGAGVTRRRAR